METNRVSEAKLEQVKDLLMTKEKDQETCTLSHFTDLGKLLCFDHVMQ